VTPHALLDLEKKDDDLISSNTLPLSALTRSFPSRRDAFSALFRSAVGNLPPFPSRRIPAV